MIKYTKKDITTVTSGIIAHGVNGQKNGFWGGISY